MPDPTIPPGWRILEPEAWPADAGWLTTDTPALSRAIVHRALKDIGIEEVPVASNRGVRIDRMTKRAGLQPPQYWCAIWVGCVWGDAGSLVPLAFPSCDAWLPHIEQPSYAPSIGDAILYGLRKGQTWEARTRWDAHHIGIVARIAPAMRSIEGNRSWAGTQSNNGQAVDLGPIMRRDILGYVRPRRQSPLYGRQT